MMRLKRRERRLKFGKKITEVAWSVLKFIFSEKYELIVGARTIPNNKTLLIGPPANLNGRMVLGAWYVTNKFFRVDGGEWQPGPALVILPWTAEPFSSVQITVDEIEEVISATAMIVSDPKSP